MLQWRRNGKTKNVRKGPREAKDVGEKPFPSRRKLGVTMKNGEYLARNAAGEAVWGSEIRLFDGNKQVLCRVVELSHTSLALDLMVGAALACRVALPTPPYPHEDDVTTWSAVLRNGHRQVGYTRESLRTEKEKKPRATPSRRKKARSRGGRVRLSRSVRFTHAVKARRKVG